MPSWLRAQASSHSSLHSPWRRSFMIKACVVCGTVLNAKFPSRKQFCGRAHYEIQRTCRRTGRSVQDYFALRKCPECEREVRGKISKIFCSKKCRGRHEGSRTAVTKLCAICDGEFRPSGNQHTCSLPKCRSLLLHFGKLTASYRKGWKSIIQCPRCLSLFMMDGPDQKLCQPCAEQMKPMRQYHSDLKRGLNAHPPTEKCRQCGGPLDRASQPPRRRRVFCSCCITLRRNASYFKHLSNKIRELTEPYVRNLLKQTNKAVTPPNIDLCKRRIHLYRSQKLLQLTAAASALSNPSPI